MPSSKRTSFLKFSPDLGVLGSVLGLESASPVPANGKSGPVGVLPGSGAETTPRPVAGALALLPGSEAETVPRPTAGAFALSFSAGEERSSERDLDRSLGSMVSAAGGS